MVPQGTTGYHRVPQCDKGRAGEGGRCGQRGGKVAITNIPTHKPARSPRAAPSSASQARVPSTRRRESHNYLLDFLQQLLLFTVPLINLLFKKLMPCHAAGRAMISRSCCRFRVCSSRFSGGEKKVSSCHRVRMNLRGLFSVVLMGL